MRALAMMPTSFCFCQDKAILKNKQAHGLVCPWACSATPQAAFSYFSLTTSSTGFAVARLAGV
jgi:hypothetical protein